MWLQSCRELGLGLALLATGGALCGAEEIFDSARAEMTCHGWRGTVEVGRGESAEAVVVEVSLGREAALVGALTGPHHARMVFMAALDDAGLVSMTWLGGPDPTKAPLVLWSDGHCEYAELGRGRGEVALGEAAPWLRGSLTAGWQALLAVATRSLAADRDLQEFQAALAELDAQQHRLGEEHDAIGCSWVTNPEECAPRSVESRLDDLTSRYRSQVDLLDRVEALRGYSGAEASESTVSAPPAVQPQP